MLVGIKGGWSAVKEAALQKFTITEDETKFIKQNLNLNTDKKTILYAPSFYPTSIEKLCPQLSVLC